MKRRPASTKSSTSSYECPWCFESIETFPDLGGGEQQQYVEDCSVCCHPNVLFVSWNDEERSFDVSAARE